MQPLIHCIYSSAAAPTFGEHEIPLILEKARTANAACNVTGMLLYVGGSFFQVLEGEAAIVEPLLEKIRLDPRHCRMTLIIKEPLVERSFGEWTMGFASLDAQEAGDLVGANDFFDGASCLAKMTAGRAKKLLSTFRDGRWRMERTGVHRLRGRMA